ncbi:unnamed protein product [Discula destructiva]
MARPVKEPENIDDPPQDSASEDEPDVASSAKYFDSSDDQALTASIKRTKFANKPSTATSSAAGQGYEVKGRGSTQGRKTPPNRSSRATKRGKTEAIDSEEDQSLYVKKKKTAKSKSDEIADEVGGHMKFDPFAPGKGMRPSTTRKYGGKPARILQNATARADRLKSRMPSDSASPVKGYKTNERYGSVPSSPAVSRTQSQKMVEVDGFSSDLSDPPTSDKSDPPRALDRRVGKGKPIRKRALRGKNNVPDFSAEAVSQIPIFKMPDAYRDYVSEEPVDSDTVMDETSVQTRQLEPGMALCPMCDEQVEEGLLTTFSKGEKMKLAQQAKFCRMHKKNAAEKTYKTRKYPNVDWTTLRARIKRHHDYLKSLIMGTQSHFGDILTENIRIGQDRTLLTTKEYPTPGYYGLRGMNIMTEVVTERFSGLLRKRAPIDTRISGRGYTGFVQSVLVPELAVKLIQEDLSLDEAKARELMIESRAVGEILNDEKRHSQSQAQARISILDDSHAGDKEEEEVEEEESENDDDNEHEEDSGKEDEDVTVGLRIQEAAQSDSDVSNASAQSQRQASTNGEQPLRLDGSDSDRSLTPLDGRPSKKAHVALKKQNVTTLPTRASPNGRANHKKSPVHANSDIVDSADSDSSDLSSILEPL